MTTTTICDFCTAPATRYARDSGEETPLCTAHAREHYGPDWRELTGTIGPRWHARHTEENKP